VKLGMLLSSLKTWSQEVDKREKKQGNPGDKLMGFRGNSEISLGGTVPDRPVYDS